MLIVDLPNFALAAVVDAIPADERDLLRATSVRLRDAVNQQTSTVCCVYNMLEPRRGCRLLL